MHVRRWHYLVYNGELLSATLNKGFVTTKSSLKNKIERIEEISKASTYGEKIYVTRGNHIILDDMCKAVEKINRKEELKDIAIENNQNWIDRIEINLI